MALKAKARRGFDRKSKITVSRGCPLKARQCSIGGGKCLSKKGGSVLCEGIKVKYGWNHSFKVEAIHGRN